MRRGDPLTPDYHHRQVPQPLFSTLAARFYYRRSQYLEILAGAAKHAGGTDVLAHSGVPGCTGQLSAVAINRSGIGGYALPGLCLDGKLIAETVIKQ